MLSTPPTPPSQGGESRASLRKGVKGCDGPAPGATIRSRRGFTALDVLVVLFLIGLFAMVLLMAMPRGREAARLAACQRNLAQIGMASRSTTRRSVACRRSASRPGSIRRPPRARPGP